MSTSILGLGGRRRADLEVVVRAGTATALLASATVHSTLAAEHYGDLSRAGTLFLVLQLIETSLAMAVISAWSFTTAVAVLATSLATFGLWLVSRTTGAPVAAGEFKISWLSASDLACGALELTAAALVIPWLLRAWPSRQASRRRRRRGRSLPGSPGGARDDLHRLVDPRRGRSVGEDAHPDVSLSVDGRRGEPHSSTPVDAP
jgi:hypothetical protein